QVLDLALLAQLGERAERLGERAGDGRVAVGTATEAQVHDVERLDPEGPQVRLDLGAQLLGRARVRPAAVLVAHRADLGDDVDAVVRREGLADDLVDDVRAVEVRGVDVVHPGLDGRAQHADRLVPVGRGPPDARAGELHGAEPLAREGDALGRGEGSAGRAFVSHGVLLSRCPTTGRCSACGAVLLSRRAPPPPLWWWRPWTWSRRRTSVRRSPRRSPCPA